MAIIRDGVTAANLLGVDPTLKALRSSSHPMESLGQYTLSEFTGLTTGIAANGEVFQVRWTDATNLMVLRYLKIRWATVTGFTAAQECALSASKVSAWSADGSGGTTITPSVSNTTNRNSYPVSKIGSMRIATTGALTAGTKTIAANPFLTMMRKTMAAAATVQDTDFEAEFRSSEGNVSPIILAQNEGIVVRNVIAQGAGGTARLAITMYWEEILATDYPTL